MDSTVWGSGRKALGNSIFILALCVLNIAYAGQCTGIFDAPLQSHGRGIDLSWGVSIATDTAVLPTPRLKEAWYWKSCGDQACQASGSASETIELPAFITTDSLFNLYQPAYASEQLFVDYANEFATAYIGSGSTVEIGGDYQFYAFKELTLDYASTVILAPGDYWIESLYLSTSSAIKTKGGQVRLFVRDHLDARYQASINEDKNASVLIVGWDQMSFDGSNKINASVYSAAKISAGWATDFSGPLAADSINFYANVSVRNDNDASQADLFNGLCSDYGPLPDSDADGWADGIDPDKNNDGVLDSQEGKVDPTDSGFGFRTVDDGYGNLVDTNQCTDTFSTGLQSFGERGWIDLKYNAQLLSSPSLLLPARYVSVPRWSSVASCEVGPCMASGLPSSRLPERLWPETPEIELEQTPRHWHRFNNRNRNRPQALVVRPFSDLTLESQTDGLIGGDVQVLYKGTLTLQPGDYWFNSLQINSNAKLLVEGEGTARVYVKNGVSVGYRSTVNVSAEADAAAKLLIVSYDDVYISNNTEVNAWIVAEDMVSSSGHITGGISAARIALWPFATVTYDYPALWKTDFSVHCDIDNDGEYDLFDEDRDNDGISNEYEKELGFDPTDPEHTPPDMDSDGIPDALDDDRDGDGVNNDEDVFPDDSSEWADMDGDGIGDNSDPDRDGDNFSNEEEIQQGTDPNDATDYPDIIAPTVEFNELISLTNASSVSVKALAEDEYSGLKSVVLKNTTTDEEIAMTLNAGNEFLASIELAEGNNMLVVTATDNWDNQTSAQGTVNKDSTAPSLTIAAPQNFAIQALQMTFTLSIEDENSGIQSVSAQNQNGTEFTTTADDTQENTYSLTAVLTEGSNTLTFSAVDKAGNKTVLSQSVLSDVSAPEFSQPQLPSLSNQAEETVSIFISDQYSDIADASLSVNSENVAVSLQSSGNGVLLNATVPLQEADNALVFSATDALGNSASASFAINRDSTSPELSLTPPASQWQAEEQYELTGTVTDENSGLASVLFGSQTLTVTDNAFSTLITLAEELNTLTVIANDIAGNTSEASVIVGWDNTDPVLTLDQNPTLITNISQWDISGSVSDAHSGVGSLIIEFADGKQQTVTITEGIFATSIALTEGQTEGELVLTDLVGHSTRQAFSVLLDQVAPELTLSFNDEPISESNPIYVNQAEQTVALQMADESSGLAQITASLNAEELTATTASTELALTLVNGENTLTVSLTDVAGNQTSQTVRFILDTTPPAINWLSNTDPTGNTDYTAQWQATDASGISSQQLTLNNESVEFVESNDQFEAALALTEGSNSIELTVTDVAGNQTQLAQSILADITPPVFSQWQVPSLTNAEQETVSVLVTDQYSDIGDVSLTVNGENTAVSLETTDAGLLLSATATLQEGNNTLVFNAADVLENSLSATVVINRDSTSPELALTEPVSQWQAENQYQLNGTVTDENSGLANVLFGSALLTVTDNTFSTVATLTEGLNTLTVVANDIAGNSSEASIVVGWDNTDPVLTLDQNATLVTNNSQWNISGSASDAHSGVASLVIEFADGKQQTVTVTGGSFATSLALTEGQTEGELVLTDNVGHSTRQAFAVLLDQVAPELTLSFNNEALSESNPIYVNQASQTVALQMADESSGLANATAMLNDTELTITTQSTELALSLVTGENQLTVSVTDVAGNQSTQTISFILDQTPPTINWLTDTDPTNSTSVTARWQAIDANGIGDQQLLFNSESLEITEGDDYFEAVITLKEGQNRLALTVSDTAGNAANLQHTLVLDTLAPELTLNALPASTAQSAIDVSGQVSDGLPITVLINGQAADISEQGSFTESIALSEGGNDILVQASDALGNLTQQSVSIVSDRIGPVINASIPATVEEEILTLTGSVSDALSAVKTVTVQNQTTGLPYQVSLAGDQFSADVVLEDGINELLITAVDELGNENTVSLSTELILDRLVWTWLSDASQPTTEASIILEGLLETELATSDFTINVAGQTATVSRWSEGVYSVRSAVLDLEIGNNSFDVVATAANAEMTDSITIERVESDEIIDTTFNLTVSSPANGLQVSGEYITVSGTVEADSTPTVSINGDPVSLTTSLPYYYFNATLQIPQDDNSFSISIVAQSAGGATEQITRTVYLDTAAPVLTLTNTLLAYPESTLVIENPYTLSGRVRDANFSSLTLNGNLVSVTPTGDDEYTFSAGLSLPNNAETQIELIAQDSAGNRTTQMYLLNAQRSVELSWLLPTADSQLISYGEAFAMQVILQSTEITTSGQYQIRLRNSTDQTSGDWVNLSFANRIASTDLSLDGSAGEFHIEARVIDSEGNILASAQPRAFTVNAPATVPVELSKVQPEQGATDVDTKETVSLFFNQSIDADLLTVNLYETAYGKTWINQDEKGTEFFNAKGHQLVDVQRDYLAVPISWQLASDGKTVLISLGREPAYDATLFVEVAYDGDSLVRYQYQTQALPTLVNVTIRDQYNRDVRNLRVTFAGQTHTTNDQGVVQFGYNDSDPLATGSYSLWVNPSLINPAYGETKLDVPIDGGRLNDLGVIPVSYLNPEIGASYLRSGQNHSLIGDEVLMDLTNAQVTFADGRTQGRVHVQFNTSGYSYPTYPYIEPNWLYSFQPLGIQLSGNADIQLKLPKLLNSWEYLPENGSFGLLMAVDTASQQIKPIGVVQRQGAYANVMDTQAIDVLDHLGVLFLPEEFQSLLVAYQQDQISFNVLIAQVIKQFKEQPTVQVEVTQ